ncbi:MAG TPA: LysR substrate-binding domain-containing protein [Acidimicrobiales bacterium]|nr:LysR substrate-binding domain-containing protein [Acidimicrobiales bacterium]
MELRQLEALIEIEDRGSFSAAAVSLGTVQSNVSARIARLERELDTTLVDRGTGRLTEAGDAVAARARRILSEVDAAVADVASANSEVAGTVGVGVIGTTGRWLVPQLLDAQRRHLPRVALRIVEGTTTTLQPQLGTGQLDLAVVTLPVHDDGLATSPLFDEDLVLVVGLGHPLTRAEHPVGFDVVAGLDLLLPLTGTALRDELDEAASAAGVQLRAAIELDGLRTIASLVFDGYGPAILPATAVPKHLRGRFALIPIRGLGRRHVGIAVRRHGLPSAPSRSVRALLEQLVSDGPLPSGLHPRD